MRGDPMRLLRFSSLRAGRWVVAACAIVIATAGTTPAMARGGTAVSAATAAAARTIDDPATWSSRRLAAQLLVACIDDSDLRPARDLAAHGIGGVVLLGSSPDPRLRERLAAARRDALGGVPMFVMSDEEGGQVQRLRSAIQPLPSARTMGGWKPSRVRETAQEYAARMRALGVDVDLAPVADLNVPGAFIAEADRAFAASPSRVASHVIAWQRGMADADVVTFVKHWPGHGSATDTHLRPARIAPLAELEQRDLRPFAIALKAGAPAIMVGHLRSKGLTEKGVPASESPRALAYLRVHAGPDVVIMTDALNMAAASTSLGITPARAALRALRAGADVAMVCVPHPATALGLVRSAIDSGALPRAQAVASAQRVLALKARAATRGGLTPR